ncbi:unnamed protein product [Phytomonas sp. Hart1]|nr:unnamed protein product [Phytomonas sp. Hart1]|eukprot:CCW71442.1 unnamed protein product [Phytomonas sp. isolate Hart1]
MQVDRATEFAPIKNAATAPGAVDSPATAARLLLELHTRWAVAALAGADPAAPGAIPARDRDRALAILREGTRWVEISPLVSYEGEGLLPYVEYLVQRLIRTSDAIVLIDPAINRPPDVTNELAVAKM